MDESYCSSSVFRQPHLIIHVEALTGLCYLVDDSLSLKPYVKMSIGSSSAITRVLPSVDSIIFSEVHELVLDLAEPLMIGLYDRDDFGRDALLSAHCLPYSMLERFKCPGKFIKLRLNSEATEMLEEDDFIRNPEAHNVRASMIFAKEVPQERAILELHICLMDSNSLKKIRATITDYTTVRTALGGGCTTYNISLTRNDGANWSVSLRYSQLKQLRDTLISAYPQVEDMEFPESTMWSWLFKSSQSQSKLNKSRIENRREQLEAFLNELCDMDGPSDSIEFKELLQIPE